MNKEKLPELLAPAGNFSKLKTALYFGADAVYLGGKNFSLRAFSDNFTEEELLLAVNYVHERGKKIYITVNIFAKNADFEKAENYFKYLEKIGVDGVILTDPGFVALAKKVAPNLVLHLSTQANTLNKYSAKFWEGKKLVRDFVPCIRNSDSKYGLYDLVNSKFYFGEGDFKGGYEQ
jgi:putative protease